LDRAGGVWACAGGVGELYGLSACGGCDGSGVGFVGVVEGGTVSYHLTAVGAPMPSLHVAVKIQNNRFKIAGGAPGKEVSWRVEAIRNDLWVQRYGYQTEQEKDDAIKGKYL
jgi:hypothetical protein